MTANIDTLELGDLVLIVGERPQIIPHLFGIIVEKGETTSSVFWFDREMFARYVKYDNYTLLAWNRASYEKMRNW
jgi:hypothetical protein